MEMDHRRSFWLEFPYRGAAALKKGAESQSITTLLVGRATGHLGGGKIQVPLNSFVAIRAIFKLTFDGARRGIPAAPKRTSLECKEKGATCLIPPRPRMG